MLIQDRAVGTDLDKRFVYVVTPDRTIEYRAVTLGPIVDGLRVVRSGLERRRPRRRQRPAARASRREGRRGARGDGAVMKFSHFFIDRPIFAVVLSLLIVVGGGLALVSRCRSASIRASCRRRSSCAASYPGANPKVIAETVAAPLEQQINGVEGHALHVLAVHLRRRDDADGDLRARHRSRQRAGAGAEPRRAGAAASARRRCSASASSPRRRRPTS